jgi:hypothetical protein
MSDLRRAAENALPRLAKSSCDGLDRNRSGKNVDWMEKVSDKHYRG